MSRQDDSRPPGIGVALKDARRRIGMDVKEAEERTKIRARYLRALEAEEWEVLPAPAYVRGFLRTYGHLLGLDGEMLADEFRRRYEEPASGASAASEPILQERRRGSGSRRGAGSRPPSRAGVIAAIAVGILVLLLILGLIKNGGDDPAPGGDGKPTRSERRKAVERATAQRPQRDAGGLEPIDVTVEPLDTIQLCLVGGSKQALIDAQSLAAGAKEQFDGFKAYRLDLDGAGAVKLTAGGDTERLESTGTASFEADSQGIREIDPAGPDCP